MNAITARRMRIVLVIVSAVLVGAGAFFFATQDLSTADQYASVASFFVGLIALVATVRSFLAEKPSSTDTRAPDHERRPAGVVINNVTNCENVQTGMGSKMTSKKQYLITVPGGTRRRRKQR